jgi:hypothetical protein
LVVALSAMRPLLPSLPLLQQQLLLMPLLLLL